MHERIEKPKDRDSSAAANSITQNKSDQGTGFVIDKRPGLSNSSPPKLKYALGQRRTKPKGVVQRLRALTGQPETRRNLICKTEDGKIIASTGRWDAGELTYTAIGNGVVGQDYISVGEIYKNQGISYVLTYFAAQTWGDDDGIVYLRGGSLSPSGALVASKLSFSEYAPSNNPKKDNPKLLHAYTTQSNDAGGKIPPIKYKKIGELKAIALQKAQQHGWTFQA
ncbi:MAG: hypothetical protein MI742_09875 [Desulfobacterales bacterium]|nr:hypothetical protein [Desulfobacterales bacterium]